MPNATNEVLWGWKNRRTFAAEKFKSDIMVKIARNLTELIGHTPLLELTKIEKEKGLKARLLVKIEAFNPARSVKDRVGFALIREAERRGLIDAKTVIIEPTSGTPISVAELIKRNNVENPELVSVQLNEEFLEHSEFDTRQVNDGDEIDFLYFMGGGQAHV